MDAKRSCGGKDKKIGLRVRSRRLEIGMSQECLADLIGVTFQQVQKYEKGVNRISAGRLHDISLALACPVGDFFDGLGARSDPAGVDLQHVMATPDGARMGVLLSRLKDRPKVRRRLIELAETVAGESA